MKSPLTAEPLFHIGPVPITEPVVVAWAVITLPGRRLGARRHGEPQSRPVEDSATLELVVSTIDSQIRETMLGRSRPLPRPHRLDLPLPFSFRTGRRSIPGVEPPTAHIETNTTMALIVFVATIAWGIRTRGLGGYLATYAEPTSVMIPLNIVEQFTRTF